ncbi:phospholipase B1, membrane-associated-like isoform X2 [Dicentrarchus labrax]|uniref:phospholipase B1, membrane-associated-like isoform X2 n=1 Tax=Dicentrarchus labrax TaxID=13489 RepID=UPI0021F595ED|nr:phospholipase B1, membrane-associated-like isoform X2 [Dicentrarchus labrax]XP_051248846.1 phospholipase B1, membrane-associated-like isoform X2 [Dicentrarchus labrax]
MVRWLCETAHSYTLREEDERINQEVFGTDSLQRRLHPPFSCPDMSPSPTVPSSVEYVKAADVKVIAALGDSLTTAIGANGSNILAIPFEFRQVSWSIGGYGTYQNVITLANILKLFNPKLLGPAPVMTFHGSPTTVNETGFNFAITGHNTLNVSDQIRTMIDTFKSYPGLNFQEDWKVVTMLIGMNDICDYCKDKTLFSPDNFIHHMTEALDLMMNEIPRMIVNVVQILSMKPLRDVQRPTLGCQLQKSFCSCLVQPEENSTELEELVEINHEFQRRLEKLLHSDRFFKKDFAVVLQPYLENARPPTLPNGTIDLSFFTADCFHFTVKGHEELAKGLWNNMFQPEGEKEMIQTLSEPIKLICPTKEHPYIYTKPRLKSSSPTLKHFSMNALMSLLAVIHYL